MVLLRVVYRLSCSLNRERLKGTNQALFIFVFLALCTAPGPGRCCVSALSLQSGLVSVISLISRLPA